MRYDPIRLPDVKEILSTWEEIDESSRDFKRFHLDVVSRDRLVLGPDDRIFIRRARDSHGQYLDGACVVSKDDVITYALGERWEKYRPMTDEQHETMQSVVKEISKLMSRADELIRSAAELAKVHGIPFETYNELTMYETTATGEMWVSSSRDCP